MSWQETNNDNAKNPARSEENTSVTYEERIRKIFDLCDANEDGYIDYNDLQAVCKELNLDCCVKELMHELGICEGGKISYRQFLKALLGLRSKTAELKGKYDHWEGDSGVRDLSSGQNTLQYLLEGDLSDISSTCSENLLKVANELHIAAVTSLQEEIEELTERLCAVCDERDVLEDYLKHLKVNPKNAVVQKYEEQLTELRSIISTLKKKLSEQRAYKVEEETQSHGMKVAPDDKSDTKHVESVDADGNEDKVLVSRKGALKNELKKTKKCLQDAYNRIDALEAKVHKYERKGRATSPDSKSPKEKEQEKTTGQKTEKLPSKEVTGEQLEEKQNAVQLEKKQIELDMEKIRTKVENLEAQNNILRISFEEMRANCERLYLLLGKYESNAVSLRSSVDLYCKLVSDYEELVSLLVNCRRRDATVSEEEQEVRSEIASLKKQQSKLEPTVVVELESFHNIDINRRKIAPVDQKRIATVETAVLIQDLTEVREENAKLKSTIFKMKREFQAVERRIIQLEEKLGINIPSSNDELSITLSEKLKNISLAFENVIKKAELKCQKSSDTLENLKNINSMLLHIAEDSQRDFDHHLCHLEDNLVCILTAHTMQINDMRERLALLEQPAKSGKERSAQKSFSDIHIVIKSSSTSS